MCSSITCAPRWRPRGGDRVAPGAPREREREAADRDEVEDPQPARRRVGAGPDAVRGRRDPDAERPASSTPSRTPEVSSAYATTPAARASYQSIPLTTSTSPAARSRPTTARSSRRRRAWNRAAYSWRKQSSRTAIRCWSTMTSQSRDALAGRGRGRPQSRLRRSGPPSASRPRRACALPPLSSAWARLH